MSALTLIASTLAQRPLRAADCNKNGTDDSIDIQSGVSSDCNANSIPDECDVSPLELGYTERSAIQVGSGVAALIATDLDGDRDLDIASANVSSNDASVVLNDGSGHFADSVSYPAGLAPVGIATGDLDGDGQPELVVANSSSSTVSILKNSGAGTFAKGQDLTVLASPFLVAAKDLDGDQDTDLAVLSLGPPPSSMGLITIFLNDGSGNFAEGSTFSTRRDFPNSLAAGDLDGNGSVDLAVGNSFSSDVSIFLNNGDGTFRVAPDFPIIGGAGLVERALTIGDLDRDGDLDLAVAPASSSIVVLLNQGNGTFAPPVEDGAANQPTSISAVDLDGNGNLDLIVGDAFSGRCGEQGTVRALYNRGKGIFRGTIDLRVDFRGSLLVVADLDQDGDPELVSDRQGSKVSVFFRELKPQSSDCNRNGIPDECELGSLDCNLDRILDSCEVESGESADCNRNGIPDECEADCNGNATPDECDVAAARSLDCNQNGIPDECELALSDRDLNGVPDDCDIQSGQSADCNSNGLPDRQDLKPVLRFSTGVNLLRGKVNSPTLADMDSDGDLDLAAFQPGNCCPNQTGSVSVYLSDRGGSFLDGSRLLVGLFPTSLFSTDLDGDGDLDLLSSNGAGPCPGNGGWVAELINRGNGQLSVGQKFAMGTNPFSLAAGDLDGDGDEDAVVESADFQSRLLIFLKDGNGSFTQAGRLDDVAWLPRLALLDLDGDGDLDLAASHLISSSITFFYNNGRASFPARAILDVSFPQLSIFPADLDGDKKTDLALGLADCFGLADCIEMRTVLVLWNRGDGTFDQARFPSGPRSGPVVVVDLDGDGDSDLVSTGASSDDPDHDHGLGSGQAAVLLNNGHRTFSEPRSFLVPDNAECIGAGDVDGDGDADLILHDKELLGISLVLNGGKGSFDFPRPVSSVPGGILSLQAADLDGDRDNDLAAASAFRVEVFLNNGDGHFEPNGSIPVGSSPIFLLAADFNGDGQTDLSTVNLQLAANLPSNVSVILSQGNGKFAPARNYAVGFGAVAMAAADLDGDGDLDLAVANSESDFFSMLLNRGNGTFEPAVHFAARLRPTFVAAADLDGDRDVDLAMADSLADGGQGKVSTFRNSGQAMFSGEVEVGVGSPMSPQSLTTADLDGDRDQDIAVVGDNHLSVLLNRGDGTFLPAVDRTTGVFLAGVLSKDLDGDEDLDIAALDLGLAEASIFLNHGDGTFGEPVHLAVELFSSSLVAADLDGDRDLDLALAGFGNTSLVVIENLSGSFSRDLDHDGVPDECRDGNDRSFRRGDANQDSRLDLSDAVTILKHLFQGGPPLDCNKAADANDDARINLSDAVTILLHLFSGQGPLPEPSGACGKDPTPDQLGCREFLGCGG